MSWTDERVSLLKKMWVEGKTAAEIAKELGGVTRNAVIGKAHRLKLSNRISPIQQNTRKPVVRVSVNEDRAPAPVAKLRVAPPAPARPIKIKGVKMQDLKERMCRWPLGDPRDADFHFCGCNAVPGLPYCPDHAKMAYQAARNSRALNADDYVDQHHATPADDESKDAVA